MYTPVYTDKLIRIPIQSDVVEAHSWVELIPIAN